MEVGSIFSIQHHILERVVQCVWDNVTCEDSITEHPPPKKCFLSEKGGGGLARIFLVSDYFGLLLYRSSECIILHHYQCVISHLMFDFTLTEA